MILCFLTIEKVMRSAFLYNFAILKFYYQSLNNNNYGNIRQTV